MAREQGSFSTRSSARSATMKTWPKSSGESSCNAIWNNSSPYSHAHGSPPRSNLVLGLPVAIMKFHRGKRGRRYQLMPWRIVVRNPSDYPRSGFASIPWQPVLAATEISHDELVLSYRGTQLKAQVDYPDDPGQATLTFFLPWLPEGVEDYSSSTCYVEIQRARPIQAIGPLVEKQDHTFNPPN